MEVQLQFTQDDRDLLRDTNADVKRVLNGQETHGVEDNRRFAEIDTRLKKLEKWQTTVIAASTVVAFFAGLAARLIGK